MSSGALVNPFCRRTVCIKQPMLDVPTMPRVSSVSVDNETLCVEPVYDSVDTVSEIQACKDLCGMEYMKKLLASGRVTAEDLQDNAGGFADLTRIPQDVHTAKRLADEQNKVIAAAAKAAGARDGEKYSQKQIEEMLSAAVRKVIESQQQPAGGDSK